MSHCEELGGREKLLPQDGNLGRRRRHDRKFNNGQLPKARGTPVKNDDGKKSERINPSLIIPRWLTMETGFPGCHDKSMLAYELGTVAARKFRPAGRLLGWAANRSGLCAEAAMTVNILEF
ncbi:uncharacterized protein [Haliotis asinina]|uniref:uncharacterized protein n=1 Tax=Haliotis asinina TaxID=109174 RepID=UPI00353256A8